MSPKSSYKQFVSQFSLPEWKRLCKHRLFLHFLKTNLKIAASIAADALQRPVRYGFGPQQSSSKNAKKIKNDSSERNASAKFRQRRFRL